MSRRDAISPGKLRGKVLRICSRDFLSDVSLASSRMRDPHVFCLVFGSQRHFVKPRLNGSSRVFFLCIEVAAQLQSFAFRGIIF